MWRDIHVPVPNPSLLLRPSPRLWTPVIPLEIYEKNEAESKISTISITVYFFLTFEYCFSSRNDTLLWLAGTFHGGCTEKQLATSRGTWNVNSWENTNAFATYGNPDFHSPAGSKFEIRNSKRSTCSRCKRSIRILVQCSPYTFQRPP